MNKEQIIKENGLELVETGFFRNKDSVSRVKDANGNKYILKTGGIDPFQIKLFEIARAIESKLSFKVPAITKKGEEWVLLEEIEGKFLNDFYGEKPDWCVEISKKIADDYQLVIQELLKKKGFGNLLDDGEKWLFLKLDKWSKPIIDAGLVGQSTIDQLRNEFEEVISSKGDDFFGWIHGNIIGDHLIVSGDDIYLIDLAVNPRPGKGYYDFLRALDFMLLKTENTDKISNSIPGWTRENLSEFDEKEVGLVFALRCIGILGWDILHDKVEYTKGDLEKKKQLLTKFIKREYLMNHNQELE